MMRSVVVLGVLLCVGIVFVESDSELELEETVAKCELELYREAQKEVNGGKDATDSTKSRKKRQLYPNSYYNSFSNSVGNGFLLDNVYDPVNYVQRLPYLPNGYINGLGINNLPIFQFFNRFYPVGVVRSENRLTRSYARFNSAYSEAYSDFRGLPIYNIRNIASSTVSSFGPDLQAEVYGFQGGSVRLLRQGGSLNGINNLNFPCIYLNLPNVRYGTVDRQFCYIRGFGTGVTGNPFVAK